MVTTGVQSTIDATAKWDGQVQDRRVDALLRLAGIHALQGDRLLALDDLERLLQEGRVSASYGDQIARDANLAVLHDEPRYQSVLASLKCQSLQWNATSIVPTSPELDEAQRIAGLSLFWSEARYSFVYFGRVPSLDWNQAYLEFLPKVIAAHTLHDHCDALMR